MTKIHLQSQGLYRTVVVADSARWDRRAQLVSTCQPVGCDSVPQNLN
jgi:hypothetical protein